MSNKHIASIKAVSYTPAATKIMDSAYSKQTECQVELIIDARGGNLEFTMTEKRFNTNRSSGIYLVLTRAEWNALKELIAAEGGTL